MGLVAELTALPVYSAVATGLAAAEIVVPLTPSTPTLPLIAPLTLTGTGLEVLAGALFGGALLPPISLING